jgi:hypothetical protein
VIGLIDADLLDGGTRHPNLALMKISAYAKEKGHNTELLFNYDNINKYEKVCLSKVFEKTKIPILPHLYKNLIIGGTGLFWDNSLKLPYKIEHSKPDYYLYNEYINKQLNKGVNKSFLKDYTDYSIGFATRGCFRKCEFCVNKKYDKVEYHADITEFLDNSRKYILLLDDNIFGYSKWYQIFDQLDNTDKRFQFEQGLDIRLLTKDKAERLNTSKTIGDIIFAFDFLKDKDIIEEKLKLWRTYSNKTTKLFLLSAFESQDVNDIISIFERLKIIFKYGCIPYNTRFDRWKNSEMRGMYININRWCNQPNLIKKMSFNEFCEANGKNSSTMKYLNKFVSKYEQVAKEYFNIKCNKGV